MITDWDKAYANRDSISGAQQIIETWDPDAHAFREANPCELDISYGPEPRHVLDLFLPEGRPKGLVVFVHGGYWLLFDKNPWSHFAKGPLDHGFAVAMPSYPLAPSARLSDISAAIGLAIEEAARRIEGPIHLAGHSAGGHLVARMITDASPLSGPTMARIKTCVPISGLFDLRAMLKLKMNSDWKLDLDSAIAESPVFQMPKPHIKMTAWVGGSELPEFLRHTALLENAWTGCGANISSFAEGDKHHFNVIDGLKLKEHPLTKTVCDLV